MWTFVLNQPVNFYLNNTINLRHLSQRIISCYTHKMATVTVTSERVPFLQRDAMLAQYDPMSVCLSVCIWVIHKSEFYQNA